jgi:DNA-binding MarR family transcriptional regulator
MTEVGPIFAHQNDQSRHDDEIVLGMLDAIEQDRNITQRDVARQLGIALGLTNAYLKRCVRKGLIKVNQAPARRYAYYLTPQGFAEKSRLTASYLASSFSFFRRARSECSDLLIQAASRGQQHIALIGRSDLAEIVTLVAQEHSVQVAGIVTATNDTAALKLAVMALGPVDAVMITAIENAGEIYSAAYAVFGHGHVYAPHLLRVRIPTSSEKGARQ